MKQKLQKAMISRLSNRKSLAEHEAAINEEEFTEERVNVVARVELNDYQWDEFTKSLTERRSWLEDCGGCVVGRKGIYRNVVCVVGRRTIYVDPNGLASACFVGFPPPREKADVTPLLDLLEDPSTSDDW